MIKSKTIEPNASEKIGTNASNKIEQIASEQNEMAKNWTELNLNLKAYLGNPTLK